MQISVVPTAACSKLLTEAEEMSIELADEDKQEYWRKRDQVGGASSCG